MNTSINKDDANDDVDLHCVKSGKKSRPTISLRPKHDPQASLGFENFLCQYADVISLLN